MKRVLNPISEADITSANLARGASTPRCRETTSSLVSSPNQCHTAVSDANPNLSRPSPKLCSLCRRYMYEYQSRKVELALVTSKTASTLVLVHVAAYYTRTSRRGRLRLVLERPPSTSQQELLLLLPPPPVHCVPVEASVGRLPQSRVSRLSRPLSG